MEGWRIRGPHRSRSTVEPAPGLPLRLRTLGLAALLAAVPGAQTGTSPATPCTRVEGTVSGTWTLGGSPYCVTGDLAVERGVGSGSLTIEPGVRVLVAQGATIRVTGRLIVEGTRTAPVVLEPADPSRPWAGLFFDAGDPGSSLTNARVRGANHSGIRILDTVVPLTGCVVEDSTAAAGDPNGGGIQASLSSGDLVLRGCTLARNAAGEGGDGGGLWASLGNGDLELVNCTLEDNVATTLLDETGGGSGGGLHASLAAGRVVVDRSELLRNRASHVADGGFNRGGGLSCVAADEVLLTDTLVAGNECYNRNSFFAFENWAVGGGVGVADADLTLRRCVFRANRARASYWIPFSQNGFPNGRGGGVDHEGAGALVVESSLFAGNVVWGTGVFSEIRGGAIHADGDSLAVTNTTIGRNQLVWADGTLSIKGWPGSGIYSGTGTAASITSSIVSRDSVAAAPGEPSTFPPEPVTSPVLTGAAAGPQLFAGQVPTVRYTNVEGGFAGVGNLDVEPLFRGTGTSCGAMEILPTSLCVDAGDPAPVSDDVAFPPSLGTTRNDMGANGGPLAGGWGRWARGRLRLEVEPRATPCTPDLALEVSGGYLQETVELWLEAVDGVPIPPVLLAAEPSCAAGRLEDSLFLPGSCESSSWTVRARSVDALGNPVESNPVVW